MTGRGARRLFGLTLVLAALGVGEVAARGVLPPSIFGLVRPAEPPVRYRLRPGAAARFEGAIYRIPPTRVEINSRGWRTREWADAKPPGVRRVACLGDSVTFGWGVERSEAWPAQLEALLASRGGEAEALSFGVFGYGAREEAEVLERDALPLAPDAVVVQFSSNDLRGGGPGFPLGSFELAQALDRSALWRAAAWTGRVAVAAVAALDEEAESRRREEGVARVVAAVIGMGESLRAAGVPGVFLFRDDGTDGVGVVAETARNAGFRLADYTEAWRPGDPMLEIPRDGHPTRAGHAILAEAAYAALARAAGTPTAVARAAE